MSIAGRAMTWVLLLVALLAIAAVATVWLAQVRWDAATGELKRRLVAQAASAAPGAASGPAADDRQALPAPVQRWLDRALPTAPPTTGSAARRVRIHWAGEFNLGSPGADRWVPFTAVQDFVPGAPGFIWDARMTMPPGLPVRVRDALVDGQGQMRGAILGLVVDKVGGSAITQSALLRYLGEAAWFPAALLTSPGLRWQAVDHTRALATLRAQGVEATAEFRFAGDGRLTSMYAASRSYDDGRHAPSEHAWQGRYLSHRRVDGIEVPDDAIVEWLLPSGTYAYWKGRPLRIQYDSAD